MLKELFKANKGQMSTLIFFCQAFVTKKQSGPSFLTTL